KAGPTAPAGRCGPSAGWGSGRGRGVPARAAGASATTTGPTPEQRGVVTPPDPPHAAATGKTITLRRLNYHARSHTEEPGGKRVGQIVSHDIVATRMQTGESQRSHRIRDELWPDAFQEEEPLEPTRRAVNPRGGLNAERDEADYGLGKPPSSSNCCRFRCQVWASNRTATPAASNSITVMTCAKRRIFATSSCRGVVRPRFGRFRCGSPLGPSGYRSHERPRLGLRFRVASAALDVGPSPRPRPLQFRRHPLSLRSYCQG